MTTIQRIAAVRAVTGHSCNASIYNAIRAGTFTKPVKIGPRAVGWPLDEIKALNAARIAGRSDDDIKALVNRLHAKREALALELV